MMFFLMASVYAINLQIIFLMAYNSIAFYYIPRANIDKGAHQI